MSRIAKFLSKDCIAVPMTATDARSAIDELLAPLEARNLIEPGGACIESILKRERRMSTGVGKGVALPHGLSGQVEDVVISMGISPAGIDFRAVDGILCHIFILLVSPRQEPDKHLKLLSRFTKILNESELRSALLEAQTADELLEMLEDWESTEDDVFL